MRIRASWQAPVLTAALCLLAGAEAAAGDAVERLRQYVRIDTSNPPGREDAAAAFLASEIHRAGVPTRLLVSPDGRVNLYAKLEAGPGARGTLVLLHHMDVVPPGPGWTTDPFGGAEEDGFLWGAGVVDDKSLGIAHLEAFLALAAEPASLTHHLVFLAVSDEEAGGAQGTGWLMERHGDLFADTVAVLTEGGSNRAFRGRLAWWGVEVAQKRPLWLSLSARGRAGHGSNLDLHSAPNRLLRGLDALLDRPRSYRITDEARLYFERIERLGAPGRGSWLAGAETALRNSEMERFLKPGQHNLFLDTIQITVLDAGRQVNAIPDEARALVDVRILPDTDADALLAEIRSTLGSEISVEVTLEAPPVAPSPIDSMTFLCLESALATDAPVVPSFMAGVTDARYFRQRGIPAYGFSPFAISPGDAQGVHGVDERLATTVFVRGVETMKWVVRTCATG